MTFVERTCPRTPSTAKDSASATSEESSKRKLIESSPKIGSPDVEDASWSDHDRRVAAQLAVWESEKTVNSCVSSLSRFLMRRQDRRIAVKIEKSNGLTLSAEEWSRTVRDRKPCATMIERTSKTIAVIACGCGDEDAVDELLSEDVLAVAALDED